MPVEQRFNGKVFKKALASMSPELMQIRSANTNLKASYTPVQTTAIFYINRLLKKLCGKALVPEYPSRQDRSWPDRDSLFRENDNFYAIACGLSKSERLEGLGIFDAEFVNHCINKHVAFESNYGALIATLITMDTFLSLS